MNPQIPVNENSQVDGNPRLIRQLWEIKRYPIIPAGILGLIILAAVFAPLIAPHDPEFGYLGDREIPPFWSEEGSFNHLLGTDQQGRDIFSRIIFGARISMVIVITVIAIGGTVGVILGMTAAWYGKHVDEFIMRLVDFTLAMPFILIALVTVIVFGQSLWIVILLLAVFSWKDRKSVV